MLVTSPNCRTITSTNPPIPAGMNASPIGHPTQSAPNPSMIRDCPVPSDEPPSGSRPDQPTHTGRREGKAVLPRLEVQLPEHQHRQQRLGAEDHAVHQHPVKEDATEPWVRDDVVPAVGKLLESG